MDQAISSSTVVSAVRDQVSCDVEGEAAILHLGRGAYFGLDPVGARIWQLLQAPRRVMEIRDALLAEYEVEPGRCEGDLLALLHDLARHGLVDVGHEPAP
jgi:hypothetical protein